MTTSIGVFDSGVGGLSVLRRIRQRLPASHLHYLADQAYAPYGERSLDEVAERAVVAARHLIDNGAGVVVVACNTASAAGLARIRAAFPSTPIVGTEPAVKPAAAHTSTGVIGVLATSVTFAGEMYANVVGTHAANVTVINRVGEGLAMAVERGEVDCAATDRLLAEHIDVLLDAGADTLVLGCTHYPFLVPAITRIAGDRLTIVDPSDAVARQAAKVARGVIDRSERSLTIETTGDADSLADQIARLLHEDVAVREVQLSDPAAQTDTRPVGRSDRR